MASILDLAAAKAHLNILDDTSDDALIAGKLAAAKSHISRRLGFDMDTAYTDSTIPADLAEATLQLMAHWYENREGVIVGVSAQSMPLGIDAIILEHRNWSF